MYELLFKNLKVDPNYFRVVEISGTLSPEKLQQFKHGFQSNHKRSRSEDEKIDKYISEVGGHAVCKLISRFLLIFFFSVESRV